MCIRDSPHFEMIQNTSYFGLQWHHKYHCSNEYQISIIYEDDINLKSVVNVPSLQTLLNNDNLEDSLVTIDLLDFALKQGIIFDQCTSIKVTISPILHNTQNQMNVTGFERTFRYFTHSLPPSGLEMITKDSDYFDITWNKKDCYESYLINISNSTYSWNQTVINNGSKHFEIGNLHACTKYILKLWSVSEEKGLSQDHSYLTIYTEHPEDVNISANATFNEISFSVTLHGTDCLTHYVLYLCSDKSEAEGCYTQVISEEEKHVEFVNLKDGTSYSYELIGYDLYNSTVFTKPKQSIKTQRIITTELVELEITDKIMKLELVSNLFEESVENKNLEIFPLVSCLNIKTEEMVNITFTQSTAHSLFEVEPYSDYKCKGILTLENITYESNNLDIRTKDGIPSMPVGQELVSVTPREAVVKWKEPSVLNGEYILDYRIEVIPGCNKPHEQDYCEIECDKHFVLHTNETYIDIKELLPYNTYTVQISAKTKNPTYGLKTDKALIIKTPPEEAKPPNIEKLYETSKGDLVIEFKPGCPLTGKTEIEVHWNLSLIHI